MIAINQRLTHNERFGASGAVTRLKVSANLQVLRPSERQWKPRLPQAAWTLPASSGQRSGKTKARPVKPLEQEEKLKK